MYQCRHITAIKLGLSYGRRIQFHSDTVGPEPAEVSWSELRDKLYPCQNKSLWATAEVRNRASSAATVAETIEPPGQWEERPAAHRSGSPLLGGSLQLSSVQREDPNSSRWEWCFFLLYNSRDIMESPLLILKIHQPHLESSVRWLGVAWWALWCCRYSCLCRAADSHRLCFCRASQCYSSQMSSPWFISVDIYLCEIISIWIIQ